MSRSELPLWDSINPIPSLFCPGILMLLRPKMSCFMKNREPTSGLKPLTYLVSGVRGLRVAEASAVHTPPLPTTTSLRLLELVRVLLVASFLQGSGTRVDHERCGRLVGVVADAVPLALGYEHGIALAQAHW